MSGANFNDLDFWFGSNYIMELGPYASAGAAGTLEGMGYLEISSIEADKNIKKIEPPNVLWPVGVYAVGRTFKIVGNLWQADLEHLAIASGDNKSLVKTNAAGTGTPANRTYPIGTDNEQVVDIYQCQVTFDSLSMQPGGGTTPIYVKRKVLLWKAVFEPKVKLAAKKDGTVVTPFSLEALWDDTVTVDDKKGKVGYWMDEAAA
jgi:hypothetical protein